MISWVYDSNSPMVPMKWAKEENPLFQVLSNVGVTKKTLPIRIATNGPQAKFVPGMADMWEWLLLQNALINFAVKIKIGGILAIIDGGKKIFLTTMDCSKASFLYNRESSIIMDTPNKQLVDLFTKTFDEDFTTSIPFLPNKETILNTSQPLIDPVSATYIQTQQFKITSVPQPPPALVNSPLEPYISNVVEVNDAQFILAIAGPKSVETYLLNGLIAGYNYFLQVGIRSLPYSPMSNAVLDSFQRMKVTNVNLSYTVDSQTEADDSNVSG